MFHLSLIQIKKKTVLRQLRGHSAIDHFIAGTVVTGCPRSDAGAGTLSVTPLSANQLSGADQCLVTGTVITPNRVALLAWVLATHYWLTSSTNLTAAESAVTQSAAAIGNLAGLSAGTCHSISARVGSKPD